MWVKPGSIILGLVYIIGLMLRRASQSGALRKKKTNMWYWRPHSYLSAVCVLLPASWPQCSHSILILWPTNILSCKVLDIKLPWDSGTYIPNRARTSLISELCTHIDSTLRITTRKIRRKSTFPELLSIDLVYAVTPSHAPPGSMTWMAMARKSVLSQGRSS